MTKRIFSIFGLVALMVLMTGVLTAAAPMPVTTIELVGAGLPAVMNVGETYTVTVRLTSDQPFTSAQAMPDFQYAGKGVVAVQGGDRVGQGTEATLQVTFKAKSSTIKMTDGVAPVGVVVGVRYGSGYVAVQRFDFLVKVP
jgi:hypothetical protein